MFATLQKFKIFRFIRSVRFTIVCLAKFKNGIASQRFRFFLNRFPFFNKSNQVKQLVNANLKHPKFPHHKQ